MKKIFLILFGFFVVFPVLSQNKEVINFDERNKIISDIENKIKSFILENRNNYKLTDKRIQELTQKIKEEQRRPFFKTDQLSVEMALNFDKDYQLRKLYFFENPEDKEIFDEMAQMSSFSSSEILYRTLEEENCTVINGGFEDPIEVTDEYNFFRLPYEFHRNFECSLDFDIINTVTTVSNTEFNVFDEVDVHITLTEEGIFDPILFSENDSIQIPVVHSGNRAIKLNNNRSPKTPLPGANHLGNDNNHATRLTKRFLATSSQMSLYFNFIGEISTHDTLKRPRFIMRLYDDSTGQLLSDFCRFTETNNTLLFNNAGGYLYTDWQYLTLSTGGVHLNPNINDRWVRLEIVVTDCGETAHIGTLYIDDICDEAVEGEYPVYGDVQLDFTNPQLGNCPAFPLEICGTFRVPRSINQDPPVYGTLDYIHLTILDENNDVVNTITMPTTLTNFPDGAENTFCFTLNEEDFGPLPLSGAFEFQINANFIIGSVDFPVTSTSAIAGPDVTFIDCNCCADCCPDNQVVTEEVPSAYIHPKQAEHTLIAKNKINNFAMASYHAGDWVLLKPPFHAMTGSRVIAYVEGCAEFYQQKQVTTNSNSFIKNAQFRAIEEIELERITEINSQETFWVHPNPTKEFINISATNLIDVVIITDLNGRVVKQIKPEGNEVQINISDLEQGVYILNATSNGKSFTQKIVKQ